MASILVCLVPSSPSTAIAAALFSSGRLLPGRITVSSQFHVDFFLISASSFALGPIPIIRPLGKVSFIILGALHVDMALDSLEWKI